MKRPNIIDDSDMRRRVTIGVKTASSIYFTFRDSFVLEETPAVPA